MLNSSLPESATANVHTVCNCLRYSIQLCFWSSAIWSSAHVVQSSCFQCGMTSSLFPSSSRVHMVKSTGRRVEETASIQQWYNNRIQNTCQYWCRASVSPVYSVYWWVLPSLNYFLVVTDSIYSMQSHFFTCTRHSTECSRRSWCKLSLFHVTPMVKLLNKRKNIFYAPFSSPSLTKILTSVHEWLLPYEEYL